MLAKLLTVLLAAIMLVHGAVIVPPVAPVDSTDDYGHWATFTDVDTNFTFDLHSLGHTGPAQIISLNASNYPAWSKFTPYNSLDVDSRPLQEWGDVCSKVSSCYQKISDTANTAMIFIANTNFPRCAAIGGAVYEFFVADNYRNTVGVIVNGAIVSTAISYINAPVQKVIINSAFGGGEGDGEDSCDVRTSEMMANDYSAMVAQFVRIIGFQRA